MKGYEDKKKNMKRERKMGDIIIVALKLLVNMLLVSKFKVY